MPNKQYFKGGLSDPTGPFPLIRTIVKSITSIICDL